MLRQFLTFYRPHRRLLLLDFGCAAASGLLELMFPMAVRACMLVGFWTQTGHPVDGGYEIELAGVANER